MVKRKLGVGRGVCWRNILIAACAGVATLWTSAANATITQGDFSVFGFFETKESGRWGEPGTRGTGTPATFTGPTAVGSVQLTPGRAASYSGGSYDFNHWDLVQARQLADIRPDYHMVKNYKLFGRLDTLVLKDADFFAFYRPWYDAEGTLKQEGIAPTNRDWNNYTQRQLQEQYFRNDLREFYGQLNFTDNFSMRIGKQQVIWSEADALSGTEITNPNDLTFHWTHFETAENIRKNVRMFKFNYILPDFLKTANNELEAFVIPGDFQGDTSVVGLTDARNPWTVQAPENTLTDYNAHGQPFSHQTFADQGQFPLTTANLGTPAAPLNVYLQNGPNAGFNGPAGHSNYPTNSWDNSEFGVRYSTLLPVGNGLQASFIYLYEARYARTGLCTSCPNPRNPTGGGVIKPFPGVFLLPGRLIYGAPPAGGPVPFGSEISYTSTNYRRNHFIGLTGTYYDKDLTDMVFRYDTLYAPKVGINVAALNQVGNARSIRLGPNESSGRWTEYARFILAGDRPTYIPWISKQHTFLVGQFVETWYPDLPGSAIPSVAQPAGKVRRYSNFAFLASTNWLINGQLTSTNAFAWDIDNNVGNFGSTNVYRYSRNILLGINSIWYLGRSGRYTDPFLFSRDQRISELEATFSYEI
jgi:hypothetical protein